MGLTGQIIFKKSIFQYSFENKNKIIIRSATPAKMSVIIKVRQEIQEEIQDKIDIKKEILFEFKSLSN